MQILKGEKVTKYFGGLAALLNVDFDVDTGEIVGLIGPNGAGKTTLFNIISGALTPRSGVVTFKNMIISGESPNRICKLGISRTFQQIKVFGHMTVFQNVLMGALFGNPEKVSFRDASLKAGELIEFMEMSEFSNILAKDLTFVYQKKVEVARALATGPELLMLDEFMAGLNQTEVIQGVELVKRIRDRGITILMIEHVMTAIMSVCNRIIVLHHGEKIAEGTPSEITNNTSVIQVYFGE